MTTLDLNSCAYVCGRPTTGKSTLLVNCDNVVCLDTDFLTFNLVRSFMTERAYSQFIDEHNRIGSPANLLKVGVVEPLYRFFMQFQLPVVWVSNLCPDPAIVDCLSEHGETVFVTRDPEAAWDLMQERAKIRGKKMKLTHSDVVRWFVTPEWVPDHFSQVVELEKDEYLCDLFGVEALVTDASEVDNEFHAQQKAAFVFPEVKTKFDFCGTAKGKEVNND